MAARYPAEQRAAFQYDGLRRGLRVSGMSALLCGALGLFLGMFAAAQNSNASYGGPIFVLGLFLALCGALAFKRVHPRLLLAIGLACGMLGLWFVGMPIYLFARRPSVPGVLMIALLLGLPLILIAGGSVTRFRVYGLKAPPRPKQEALTEAKRVLDGIVAAEMKTDNEIVELFLGGPIPRLWRGRLSQKGAVLVSQSTFQTLILTPADFKIAVVRKVSKDYMDADVTMAGRTARGTLSVESHERYERWKERA